MERHNSIGLIGETRFAHEAVARGFTVLDPVGVFGFDYVVCYKDKYTRVQVKTTSTVSENRRFFWDSSSNKEQSDVHVFHVMGTDLFFFYRSDELNSSSKRFQINLNNIENEHLNNWEIFK